MGIPPKTISISSHKNQLKPRRRSLDASVLQIQVSNKDPYPLGRGWKGSLNSPARQIPGLHLQSRPNTTFLSLAAAHNEYRKTSMVEGLLSFSGRLSVGLKVSPAIAATKEELG
ncbi:hypothetical protein NE237_004720 [Protea cynaroides]|uniref:Uncharacterized protein n=1 Tax=Protea cynaroides TaxID=273540 RepID=A0A9Q0KJF8_9MAGN|nr:hypothetical protein NE237_004720 [Protea cynaroides]